MSVSVVKVLVACGSGVATSTVAKLAVEEVAARAGIPIQTFKSTIAEIPTKQHDVDVVISTANYRKPLDKPYMCAFGLISGVNKEACERDLAKLLTEVYESR